MWTWVVLMGCVLTLPAAQALNASNLWAVSGDSNNSFVPDQFSSINVPLQSVNTIATLGDGSLGFNGGLTEGPGGGLFGVANDSFGASSFYSVGLDGSISLIGSAGGLGTGFLGGLAYDSANGTFFAAVLDGLGNTSLYRITPGGTGVALGQSLGTGFSGLTYDSQNGLFYGIGNDSSENSTLYDFSLGGPVNTIGALGVGFGGLTYDPTLNAFWVIQGVNNAGSQLFQISPAGAESNSLMTLGDGFAELAVTTTTPEPSTEFEMGAGLILVAWMFRRRRQHLCV
jgi:hypothetical protein